MATDQRHVYSSHPAFSVLASALLPSPQEPSEYKISSHTSTWNLEADINEFSNLSKYRNDRRSLLRCGITIGLSYLKEWGDVNLQSRDSLGDVVFASLSRTELNGFADRICIGIEEAFDIIYGEPANTK